MQHILAPFNMDDDGAYIAMLIAESFYRREEDVALWCDSPPAQYYAKHGINFIKPYQGLVPQHGTLNVIGTMNIGSWIAHSNFSKINYICYEYNVKSVYHSLNVLTQQGKVKVNIVYIDNIIAEKFGLPGSTLGLFDKETTTIYQKKSKNSQFMLGRVGEDNLQSHYFDDLRIYENIALINGHVVIKGGLCLRPLYLQNSSIRLEESIAHAALNSYMQNIDCLYYRASITERSYTPLLHKLLTYNTPIVIHRTCNADSIQSQNIINFDCTDEAISIIRKIQTANTN